MRKISLNPVVENTETVYSCPNHPNVRAVLMQNGEIGFALQDVARLLSHFGYYSKNTHSAVDRIKSPVARAISQETKKMCSYVTLEQLYESNMILDRAIDVFEEIIQHFNNKEKNFEISSLRKDLEEAHRKYKILETNYNILLKAMSDSGLI